MNHQILITDINSNVWKSVRRNYSYFDFFQENLSLKNSKEELNVQLHQDGYFGCGQVGILEAFIALIVQSTFNDMSPRLSRKNAICDLGWWTCPHHTMPNRNSAAMVISLKCKEDPQQIQTFVQKALKLFNNFYISNLGYSGLDLRQPTRKEKTMFLCISEEKHFVSLDKVKAHDVRAQTTWWTLSD